MIAENVLQPLQVTHSAVTLATETVRSILKIDDVVSYLPNYTLCNFAIMLLTYRWLLIYVKAGM